MEKLLAPLADTLPMYVSIAAVVVVALEWIALTLVEKVDSHKEGWVNVAGAALSFLPTFAINALLSVVIMFWLYQFRLFDLGLQWWVWILAYVAYDFMSFTIHLASHKVRILWCMHSVHHSPKEMKASVSFRGSWADFLVTPHTTLWLPLLGFHPLMIMIVEGLGMIYGVPLHFSEKYMPATEPSWLRKIFMTPSIHRLHHANNDIYLDTNYALTFSIWDYVFGTYQNVKTEEKPIYGLTKELDSDNLLISQTDEFKCLWNDIKRAPKLRDKIKYLFMPPGWNHQTGGITAKDIRKQALAEERAATR